MKQFEEIKIKTNLSSNPYLLFFIWLLLIILPYYILTLSINYILGENEKILVSRTKTELIDEINKFRKDLTTESYINNKLTVFHENIVLNSECNAISLSNELERHTKSKVSVLFYYNLEKDFFDYYLDKEINKDLGMFSKRSMKNLLLEYISENSDLSKTSRSKSYFNKLLSAVGEINLKLGIASPVLSGKPLLGKMIVYYNIFKINKSKSHIFLCLFKNKNIPVREIIKNAINIKNNTHFKREVLNSKLLLKEKSDQGKLDEVFFKFTQDKSGNLSVFSKISDEILLRLATSDTYYPYNIHKLSENEPIIKVTAPEYYCEHPMRKIIKQLFLPSIIIIIIATLGIIRIGFYGYKININISGKVILWVLSAILLPFTTFIISSYYSQYLDEDYSDNEIQQYTLIQNEIIKKSIESYISNIELSIAELRKKITGSSDKEVNAILTKWLKDNGASVISYNYIDGKEKIILDKNASISKNEKDVKLFFDTNYKNYFIGKDYSKIQGIKDVRKDEIETPKNLEITLSNICKLNPSIFYNPGAVYSIFPIFDNEKEAKFSIGSVFIRFNTDIIIKNLKESIPDLFKNIYIDNYIIRNTVIHVEKNEELPKDIKKLLTNGGFKEEEIIDKLNQNINDKSQMSWKTKSSINSITYLNNINAIVISSAEKKLQNHNIGNNSIIIYMFFMILVLSIILSVSIVIPIKRLKTASEKIAEGDYSNKIEWKSGDEFENLCNSFNEMTNALAQKEKMTSYVSKEVINEVSSNVEHQLQPGGERISVSVLFCALKGEKELSSYSPEEVTKIISCLIDAVDEISTRYNGQIDKLIEDTVMVVFRQVNKEENITLNACKTALAINKRLQKELPDFKINMGIASGVAVSGKIGSRNGKLDYTVIGNPVNLSARLKVQAYKAKNTGILICPNSIRKLHGVGRLNYIERMAIKGRTNRTFPLYELLSLRDNYEII